LAGVNILLLLAHEIAEYDDLRMLTDLGYDVFSIGAYTNPARPDLTMEHGGRGLRPALPNVRYHADLAAKCDEVRVTAQDSMDAATREWMIDPAKGFLHPDLIDWADTIIVHHFPERWLLPQWSRIRGKQVIWRTCGQSNPDLERSMKPLHDEGLRIVRYSPKERRAFERLGAFAGEDAMIRFGKYPADYGPWIGDEAVIGNVTQNLDTRGEHCGYPYWRAATDGLPTKPAGTGSERLGGTGELSYPAMLEYLRHIRAYLYMGTQPASYTLGLMEAMLTGVPVVSCGPETMWLPDLFEGHELSGTYYTADDARTIALPRLLVDADGPYAAATWSADIRSRALELFDVAKVGRQWREFLGGRRVRALGTIEPERLALMRA
jgi:hypothetical protein